MARQNLLSDKERATCVLLKELRVALKISISDFAKMLGRQMHVLQSRELQKVPWRTEEITHAKAKVGEHLANGLNALGSLEP